MKVYFLTVICSLAVANADNMNAGVQYVIANPPAGHEGRIQNFTGEWFEVYTPPIKSRYSQVLWQTLGDVPLPEKVRNRFDGRIMAITGWEADVVRKTSSGDIPVPCYQSYNHHYTANIRSSQASVSVGAGPDHGHGPEDLFEVEQGVGPDWIPQVQSFNENNGNEARQTFHGLPRGYVQPIWSPSTFSMTPMQINTLNPDGSGKRGGPLPRASRAPPNAQYSGLLECPCTTRVNRSKLSIPPCADWPLSDLKKNNNPSCNASTYAGGIQCCGNGVFLLDADQEVPEHVDTVYWKWRFYFEEWNPKKHIQLVHLEWALNGCDSGGGHMGCRTIDYDVPQCAPGTPPEECVHTVTSHFTGADMLTKCDPKKAPYCADPRNVTSEGIALIMAGGHCHAPACLSLELWNKDTGELICHISPRMGQGDKAFDENGYIWLPHCAWGNPIDGLKPPYLFKPETRFMSIKKENSTYYHPGVMAIWQMRGAFATHHDGIFV